MKNPAHTAEKFLSRVHVASRLPSLRRHARMITRMLEMRLEDLRTYDDLRHFVHHALCEKENLLAEQFPLNELPLVRRGKLCGLQFSLFGPRDVRLGAVWVSDHNVLYLYDARGNRFQTFRLVQPLMAGTPSPVGQAA